MMFNVKIFVLLISSLMHIVKGNYEGAKITPISRNKLRGKGKTRKKDAQEGFIDIKNFDAHSPSVEIQFFEGSETYTFLQQIVDVDNGFYWFGSANNGKGSLNLLVKNNPHGKRYIGTAMIDHKVYEITTLENGQILAQEKDDSMFPSVSVDLSDGQELGINENATGTLKERKLNHDIQTIDIICLYTPESICHGHETGCTIQAQYYIDLMDEKCELAITETNTAFIQSGVSSRLRLVHSGMLSQYVEEKYMCTVLKDIKNGYDAYSEIHDLRDQYGADLVTILAKNMTHLDSTTNEEFRVCGCGNIYNSKSKNAYSIVDKECAINKFSVAHEIGHNLGANHEKGYHDPHNEFRTIMAYNCETTNCPRVQYFSSPNIEYNGKQSGTADDNNVGLMNQNVFNVANFRQSVHPTDNPSLSPTMKCDNWENIMVQVEIKANDEAPLNVNWNLSTMAGNRSVMSSEEYISDRTSYVVSSCLDLVQHGKCFDFRIEAGDALESFEVNVEGQTVAEGTSTVGNNIYRIGIDSINEVLPETSHDCNWLRSKSITKIEEKCDKPGGQWSKMCPGTCGACR